MIRKTCVAVLVIASCALAQEVQRPQGGWEVHQMDRPQPPKVEPGQPSTQDKVGTAPSDAVVLFDGKDLSQWQKQGGGEATWKVQDGDMVVEPRTGNHESKQQFGDCQIHIEWLTPSSAEGEGQHRGNSGVFVQGLYEIQVLDTYENKSYADGIAGSIYGEYPPEVNAARKQGQWQCYDIVFHPAEFKDGKVSKPALITVFFNGVLVQDNQPAIGPSSHGVVVTYPDKLADKGPLMLQDHGFPVHFRNIWVRELKKEKPEAPKRNPTKPE